MPYVENFQEFQRRVGGEPISGEWEIGPRNHQRGWLFPGGAFSDGNMHVEAPTSKLSLAKMKLQYLQAKEQEWADAFGRVKQAAYEASKFDGRNVPSINERHIEELAAIRDKVLELRKQMVPLQEILSNGPEAEAERKREAEAQANRARRMELVRAAEQIEI